MSGVYLDGKDGRKVDEVQILYACTVADGDFYEMHKKSLDGIITRARTVQELSQKMDGSHDLVIVFGNGEDFIEEIRTAREVGVQTSVLYLYTVFVPESIPGMEPVWCTEPSEIDAAVGRLLGAAG